jgi:hypothetical protein
VESVAFSADGKLLVTVGGTADGPGEIKVWDLTTQLRVRAAMPR